MPDFGERSGGLFGDRGVSELGKVVANREEKRKVETGGRKCRSPSQTYRKFLVQAEKVAIREKREN